MNSSCRVHKLSISTISFVCIPNTQNKYETIYFSTKYFLDKHFPSYQIHPKCRQLFWFRFCPYSYPHFKKKKQMTELELHIIYTFYHFFSCSMKIAYTMIKFPKIKTKPLVMKIIRKKNMSFLWSFIYIHMKKVLIWIKKMKKIHYLQIMFILFRAGKTLAG